MIEFPQSISKALKGLTALIPNNPSPLILANLLIKKHDGRITLTTSSGDCEMVYTYTTEELIGDDGAEFTLPARKFYDICKSLPSDAIVQIQQSDDEKAIIKYNRSKFTLATLPAKDYPESPPLDADKIVAFSMPRDTLFQSIQSAKHAMARDDVRYYLNGMLVDLQPQKITFAATDGHRLAVVRHDLSIDCDPRQAIIPKQFMEELVRLPADAEIAIMIDRHRAIFKLSDSLTVSSKIIDGKYPNYQLVIPPSPPITLAIAKEDLKQSLTRAEILCNKLYKTIRLSLSHNLLCISARNNENEEAVDEIDCDYTGMECHIGFNVSYLLDVLNAIEGDYVELGITNSDTGCIIREQGNTDTVYVAMPCRL